MALEFATLTCADARTCQAINSLVGQIFDQGGDTERFRHHRAFIRVHAGSPSATRSPAFSPDPVSDVTTEADDSDDETPVMESAPCYVLLFDDEVQASQTSFGFHFGTGDLDRFPTNAGVDFLLPPSATDQQLYTRHGYFAFDSKYGRLWLHARHKGIRVDDSPLCPGQKLPMSSRTRLSIGPHRFIFEFKVTDEAAFQTRKTQYLSRNLSAGIAAAGSEPPFESTSANPSSNDIRIGDWTFHAPVGASLRSVIHAASNIRSGESAVVKRLRLDVSGSASAEIALYDALLATTSSHRYAAFLMRKHAVLSTSRDGSRSPQESYLLWKPLARQDFSSFAIFGTHFDFPREAKLTLFVQALLGLSALHEKGWVHRDIKPANLGIVEFGGRPDPSRPWAIVTDLGQATRMTSGGVKQNAGRVGTIGYLAPELESLSYGEGYGGKVDVWSMGAVGYLLFMGGRIPWSRTENMFLPESDATNPTLKVFREARSALMRHPPPSLEWLVGWMMIEDPRERPELEKVLEHPALREVRAEVDRGLKGEGRVGEKRLRKSEEWKAKAHLASNL